VKLRVTGAKPAASNFLGVLLTEFETPLPHRFKDDDNAAGSE
jgi:hypothetical protein